MSQNPKRPAGPVSTPVHEVVASLEAQQLAPALPDGQVSDPVDWSRDFPRLRGVKVREVSIPGTAASVPCRIYNEPTRAAEAAIVWVHGGGYLFGDLEMPEAHWVSLELASRGAVVFSLDYRKMIKGQHFPAASDDVLTGWNWACQHVGQFGLSPENLQIGGASAGANLAAGVAKRLTDGAGTPPAALACAYPFMHPELPAWDSAELELVTEQMLDPYLLPADSDELHRYYAGTPEVMNDPYAFPANGDLSKLPPTWVLTCELDILRTSGDAFADALKGNGVSVRLDKLAGVEHAALNKPLTPGGQEAIQLLSEWVFETRGPAVSSREKPPRGRP
jgi:acetyl esterase/lipase